MSNALRFLRRVFNDNVAMLDEALEDGSNQKLLSTTLSLERGMNLIIQHIDRAKAYLTGSTNPLLPYNIIRNEIKQHCESIIRDNSLENQLLMNIRQLISQLIATDIQLTADEIILNRRPSMRINDVFSDEDDDSLMDVYIRIAN